MTNHSLSPFTPLVARLAKILGGLRNVVAACGGRRMLGWDRRPDDPRIVPLIIPITTRIGRLMQRFERLVARLAAGWRPNLAAVAARAPLARAGAGSAMRVRTDAIRLPSGFGWLAQYTHGATACAGHLEALLAAPVMAELIATAPSVGRVLRPLCRMLGVRVGPPLGKAVAVVIGRAAVPRRADGRFCRKAGVAKVAAEPGALFRRILMPG